MQQFQLESYNYQLPEQLIARYPLTERDKSRLLVADPLSHHCFTDFPNLIHPDDLLVFNDTKVIKARLFGEKSTGGQVELFVVSCQGHVGEAFIKASKSPKSGSTVRIHAHSGQIIEVEVLERLDSGLYQVRADTGWLSLFEIAGHIPLPPYMHRAAESLDEDRYQTLWANKPGAVAAPTASLHFSERLLAQLQQRGQAFEYLTLHVGAGTFAPVRVDDIRNHQMHEEHIEVSQILCDRIAQTKAKGGRVIAVGTTVMRALESVARQAQGLCAYNGPTDIFITPGFDFKVVDLMVTNFHLPKSTLLMLVSAFAGHDVIRRAYEAAIQQEYRFFSYGDAMLLQRQ